MIEPDYMSRIEEVASALCAQVGDLGKEIQLAWTNLESLARANADDILDAKLDKNCALRQQIRSLIRLLYRVPGTIDVKTVSEDVAQLREKNKAYGGSWCKRGGRGAFHMLARKADRLDEQLREHGSLIRALGAGTTGGEALMDTLGDLRRYLILVESWHISRESLPERIGEQILEQLPLCKRSSCGHHQHAHIAPGTGLFGACQSVGCQCLMYWTEMRPLEPVSVRYSCQDPQCSYERGHVGKCSYDRAHP